MAQRMKVSEFPQSDRLVSDEFVHVYRLGEHKVAKLCVPAQLMQAEAMRFVRKHTSLPVPEVYDAYVDESSDSGVIIMDYVEGNVLRDVWDDLTGEQQSSITNQLKAYIEELRSLKGIFIGPVDGSLCYDPTFCVGEEESFGPFATEFEFNEGLIKAMKLTQHNSWIDHITKFVRALPTHDVVFTHGDISPRNIIVRGDQVVAILDWEMSGFYPEYWEYIKALFYPDWQSKWITSGTVDRILQPWPLEHSVLLHLQQVIQGW
ncbi:hypothetical protein GX51_02774 [Blastomyces parvus]|uniref:Aminoglycoside phosphotransferase domain-containing protein n=1 Tax=Blastomyces parvus TaxID=2060905 RepID=A0A2B7XAK8_9EURO|nr:hypothetical protein GX51_02774 [Blastomyces parvus]